MIIYKYFRTALVKQFRRFVLVGSSDRLDLSPPNVSLSDLVDVACDDTDRAFPRQYLFVDGVIVTNYYGPNLLWSRQHLLTYEVMYNSSFEQIKYFLPLLVLRS